MILLPNAEEGGGVVVMSFTKSFSSSYGKLHKSPRVYSVRFLLTRSKKSFGYGSMSAKNDLPLVFNSAA